MQSSKKDQIGKPHFLCIGAHRTATRWQNSELLMCRKFTLIFTTNFVGSLDIRASREVFPIGVRSPEITAYHNTRKSTYRRVKNLTLLAGTDFQPNNSCEAATEQYPIT